MSCVGNVIVGIRWNFVCRNTLLCFFVLESEARRHVCIDQRRAGGIPTTIGCIIYLSCERTSLLPGDVQCVVTDRFLSLQSKQKAGWAFGFEWARRVKGEAVCGND